MAVVARTHGLRLVIYPNDHNPPHVHIRLSNGEECRINLLTGDFMDDPPRGLRRTIMRAYVENIEAVWSAWDSYHGNDP